MGHAAFTPNQHNWYWWEDDAAEPTTAIGSENTKPTLSDNTSIIRLRTRILETAGDSALNNGYWRLQYSLNDTDWSDLSGTDDWNWADGQATEDNTVTTNKLSDTTGKGPYRESAAQSSFDVPASGDHEWDFAIVPVSGQIVESQDYYFRVQYSSDGASWTTVALGASETHPQLTTASAGDKEVNVSEAPSAQDSISPAMGDFAVSVADCPKPIDKVK